MLFDHDFNKLPELTNAQLEVLELQSPHVQIKEDFTAIVVKVHDGDTITLRTDFRDFDFPLRFLDIDAPELSEGGDVPKEWLKNRLLGKNVSIEIVSSNRVGKYGRLLGRVISQGLNVGDEMLRQGLVFKFGEKNASHVPDLGIFLREGGLYA